MDKCLMYAKREFGRCRKVHSKVAKRRKCYVDKSHNVCSFFTRVRIQRSSFFGILIGLVWLAQGSINIGRITAPFSDINTYGASIFHREAQYCKRWKLSLGPIRLKRLCLLYDVTQLRQSGP